MATVYSNILTNELAHPSVKNTPNEQGGSVRFIRATYAIGAADELAVNDVIEICDIPQGARVVDMRVTAPASGATGEADIGWAAGANGDEAADADGFYTSDQFDPGDAAITFKQIAFDRPGLNKEFVEKVRVQATVTEITADAGGDTWEFMIWYVLN